MFKKARIMAFVLALVMAVSVFTALAVSAALVPNPDYPGRDMWVDDTEDPGSTPEDVGEPTDADEDTPSEEPTEVNEDQLIPPVTAVPDPEETTAETTGETVAPTQDSTAATEAATQVATQPAKNVNTPKTGDNLWLFIGIGVVAVAVIIIIITVVAKKKKDKEQ